jgi:hypothetical protein
MFTHRQDKNRHAKTQEQNFDSHRCGKSGRLTSQRTASRPNEAFQLHAKSQAGGGHEHGLVSLQELLQCCINKFIIRWIRPKGGHVSPNRRNRAQFCTRHLLDL